MKLNRKPPFANTAIDPDKSRSEIDNMLQDFGCEAVNWTTDWKNNKVELKFVMTTEIEGVQRKFLVDITPPTFASKHRSWNKLTGRNEEVYAPNFAQSMRLLFWWLKSKLEAVTYGLSTAENEFLSQVMTQLPSGEVTTIGKMVVGDMASGKLLLTEGKQE